MSRIEEAWARAAGVAARRLEDRAHPGPALDVPPVSLEDYPQEIGAADIVTDPAADVRVRIQTTTPDIAAPQSVTVSVPVAPTPREAVVAVPVFSKADVAPPVAAPPLASSVVAPLPS